ncbi:WD-40 repeat-containing protein [Nitzschia inconspicua]|uniref:WD-40 repeat-containing protein n=1 Tax=Nitzschia inconspicua TaxID=303405 RepID=A0A9K3Q073_9STRA|nr:WD-40 repeat-containing protein [Nitzschia inconspicua]
MDLLGDLGTEDQLTSTRAENKVLKERVEYLEGRCKVLTVENEALKAEVEIYRNEAAASNIHASTVPASITEGTPQSTTKVTVQDDFVKGGDGIYTKSKEILIENLHGPSNILCCSLSNDDSMLATGGADQYISLCPWTRAFGNTSSTTSDLVQSSTRINCDAPVIAVDFARKGHSTKFLAAGCMDGSVHVIHYETTDGVLEATKVAHGSIKHAKYVRTLVWSPNDNVLATASADGSIQVHKLNWNLFDPSSVTMEKIQTLQLSGPVESMCFHDNHLCCYARGTPYLIYFDLQDNFTQTKINLNQGPGNAGFDEHVSFAVMDIASHGSYLALATDTSRNIIVDFQTGRQIRNLYGHDNDGFSQPKIAWSKNGQYLYGNSQNDSVICVWDIASSEIVDRLEGHDNTVRDIFSSQSTDTLVTTSFDKKTYIWLVPAE